MRKIEKIIIHCSATPASMFVNAEIIRRWHVYGNKWKDNGYHYIINRSGKVEKGRPIEKRGSHAKGYNKESLDICLIGGLKEDRKTPENNFTKEQFASLKDLINSLKKTYPKITIHGHREFNPNKACPCFDVREWSKAIISWRRVYSWALDTTKKLKEDKFNLDLGIFATKSQREDK